MFDALIADIALGTSSISPGIARPSLPPSVSIPIDPKTRRFGWPTHADGYSRATLTYLAGVRRRVLDRIHGRA